MKSYYSIFRYIILFLLFLSIINQNIFAAPPFSPYNPNETLDPACAPGDTNCIVQLNFLTGEIDPIFVLSPAYSIGTGNVINWNTAFSWGDHSIQGYLTGGSLSGSIISFNSLTGSSQSLTVGNSGTGFNIVSTGGIHTFNIPDASSIAKGFINTIAQSFEGIKTFLADIIVNGNVTLGTDISDIITINGVLKILDGNQGTGKVLTSDANGNATWQTFITTDNQNLSLSGSNININGGSGIDIGSLLTSSDNQTLNFTGNTLSIDNGNSVIFSYLTGYTEIDPLFSVSPSFGISTGSIGNWNSAFGWGNHSTQGYLTGAALAGYLTGTKISSLNSLTGASQIFTTGSIGTDFNIVSTGTVHTFNIPDASLTARGLITTGIQSFTGAKTFTVNPTLSNMILGSIPFISTGGLLSQNNTNFFWDNINARLGIGTNSPAEELHIVRNQTSPTRILLDNVGTLGTGTTTSFALGEGNITHAEFRRFRDGSGLAEIGNIQSAPFGIFTNNTRALTVIGNGNIGIGTTTPNTKLEINSGSGSISGLRFTQINSGSTISGITNNFLSLDALGNVIFVGSNAGSSLPLINANGSTSSTTEIRDYNTWVTRGNGFYVTDNGGAISNPIPNEGAWFTLSQVGAMSGGGAYFGQTSLNDQNFYFRGGLVSNINSTAWRRLIGIDARSRFTYQWGGTGSNLVTLNNIDNGALAFATSNTEWLRLTASGSFGIGLSSPTALFHLKAGTSTANTAPLKFTSGVNLTIPEAGSIEYDGTQLYFSPSTTRNRLLQGTGATAFTAGSIPFATTNGYLTQSGGLFWDNTNSRLGIGSSSPARRLDVNGATRLTGESGATALQIQPAANTWGITLDASTTSSQSFGIRINAGTNSSDTPLQIKNAAQTIDYMTILGNGNTGFGTASPTSTLTSSGSIAGAIRTVIGSTTLTATDYTVIETGNPASTFTLPLENTATGRIYQIVNRGTNAATLSIGYLDYAGTSITSIPSNSAVRIQSDGTNWYQIP